jgi:hypothetical protein
MGQDIRIYPTASKMTFSGSALSSIYLQVLQSGSISYMGSSGSLWAVEDKLTGSLFSVNDISGLPLFEVFSNNQLVAGSYRQNDFVISGSRVGIGTATPQAKLHVFSAISASFFGTGSFVGTASYAGTSSIAEMAWITGVANNASYYPLFGVATTSPDESTIYYDSGADFTYNPSTNLLTLGSVRANTAIGIAAAPSVTDALFVQGSTTHNGNTYLNGAISASSTQITVTATTTGHTMYGWLNLYVPGVGLKLIQLWT